jgi:hypothetical protein
MVLSVVHCDHVNGISSVTVIFIFFSVNPYCGLSIVLVGIEVMPVTDAHALVDSPPKLIAMKSLRNAVEEGPHKEIEI